MKAAAFLLVPAAALVLQSCLPAGVTLPQSPVLKWLERKSGRIAFVALDGNVRTIDQAGAAQKDVTADASVSEDGSGVSYFYQFPAWSPDGRRLAFVGVRRTSQAVMDTGVWTAASEGKLPRAGLLGRWPHCPGSSHGRRIPRGSFSWRQRETAGSSLKPSPQGAARCAPSMKVRHSHGGGRTAPSLSPSTP